MSVLGYDEFCARLAEATEFDLAGRGRDVKLADGLELDSVQRLELLVAVEELDLYLPDDSVPPEQTLGGLYDLYVAAASGPAGQPAAGDNRGQLPQPE